MTALILLLAYLLGSIPFGLLVGKIGYGIDIREHGSGNLGGTNTFRVLGAKAGTIVIVGDMLKGTLAASLPMFFPSPCIRFWPERWQSSAICIRCSPSSAVARRWRHRAG